MIWRTDKPTGSPVVVYRNGHTRPEVLVLATKPYPHYYDDAGEEVPAGIIQKWASLEDSSGLDVEKECDAFIAKHTIDFLSPAHETMFRTYLTVFAYHIQHVMLGVDEKGLDREVEEMVDGIMDEVKNHHIPVKKMADIYASGYKGNYRKVAHDAFLCGFTAKIDEG